MGYDFGSATHHWTLFSDDFTKILLKFTKILVNFSEFLLVRQDARVEKKSGDKKIEAANESFAACTKSGPPGIDIPSKSCVFTPPNLLKF